MRFFNLLILFVSLFSIEIMAGKWGQHGSRNRMREDHIAMQESLSNVTSTQIIHDLQAAQTDQEKIRILSRWGDALLARIDKVKGKKRLSELTPEESALIQRSALEMAKAAKEIKRLGGEEPAQILALSARQNSIRLSPIQAILKNVD